MRINSFQVSGLKHFKATGTYSKSKIQLFIQQRINIREMYIITIYITKNKDKFVGRLGNTNAIKLLFCVSTTFKVFIFIIIPIN